MASTETAAGRNERLSDAERQVLRDSVRGFLASRWPASQAVAQSTDTQA